MEDRNRARARKGTDNEMKRILALLLVILMTVGLFGCSEAEELLQAVAEARDAETQAEAASAQPAAEAEEPKAEEPAEAEEPEAKEPAAETEETAAEPTEAAEPFAGLANPMREVASIDEVNDAVGCAIIPLNKEWYEVKDEQFFVFSTDPVMGEYRFVLNGVEYRLRASVTRDIICGYYPDGGVELEELERNLDNPYAIVKFTIDGEQYSFTRWYLGGMQYSLVANADEGTSDIWNMRDCFAFQLPWYMGEMETLEEQEPPANGIFYPEQVVSDMLYLRSVAKEQNLLTGSGAAENLNMLYGHKQEEYLCNESGWKTVRVSTVDGFLNALGDKVNVVLEPGVYNLTEALDYGKAAKGCYEWEETYDGYALKIEDINCTITGSWTDGEEGLVTLDASIVTVPRYSNVLTFDGGSAVLTGVQVGHTKEQGSCAGGVVSSEYQDFINVQGCDLYGCGTVGLEGSHTDVITVLGTCIHHCTDGYFNVNSCRTMTVEGCDFLDSDLWCGVALYNMRDTTFRNCTFGYGYGSAMFTGSDNRAITVDRCNFCYNTYDMQIFDILESKEITVTDCYYILYDMEKLEILSVG